MQFLPPIPDIKDSGIDLTKPVIVQEKIDGELITFGLDEKGVLYIKNQYEMLHKNCHEKYQNLVDHIHSKITTIRRFFTPNDCAFGIFLATTQHNLVKYERVPFNNLIIFGALKHDRYCNYYPFSDILGFEMIQHTKLTEYKSSVIEKSFNGAQLGGEVAGYVIKELEFSTKYPKMAKAYTANFKLLLDAEKHKSEIKKDEWYSHDTWLKVYQELEAKNQLSGMQVDAENIAARVIQESLTPEIIERIKDDLYSKYTFKLYNELKQLIRKWYNDLILRKE